MTHSKEAHSELSGLPNVGQACRPVSGAWFQRYVDGPAKAMPNRLVRAVQAARRRREALFGPELFADPAWDMLLELYALHLEQRRVSVSSLCIAAYVPATTALRWITKLEEDGLAVRSDDPRDGRRTWIELSAEGVERMRGYFEMLPLASASV
jgi:DNA-binding MarR family transcriptional regulator